jgi:hypothetical protein
MMKYLLLWNLLSVPAGVLLGALVGPSVVTVATLPYAGYWRIHSDLFGGGVGLVAATKRGGLTNWLVVGAFSKSGGFERIIGLIVSAGVLATGLVLMNQ